MILTRLKYRTLWHHQQLGKKLDFYHRINTLDDYRRLLEKLFGFYEPLEVSLEATLSWSVIEFDFQSRKKTPMLISDLHSLGVADTLFLPRCGMLPKLDTLPRVFGCLYVLESATLDGQIVLRHLNRTLGITPESGGAFFNSYGGQVITRWRDFGLQLKAYAAKPEVEEAVTRAAIDTLVRLDQWMMSKSGAVAKMQGVERLLPGEQAAQMQEEVCSSSILSLTETS